MNSRNFITGMSMGLVAGSAIGMLLSPRSHSRSNSGCMVSRCLRNMSDVIDDVSEALK